MVNYFYLRMTKKPTLIVVAGPTAVGKTSMCIELRNILIVRLYHATADNFIGS